MTYAWDDYRLDRRGTWLLKAGNYVDVSRRVLACITHLIEQRHRVVGHDELFRLLWGHESVTHHQLTQVVVAARRALEDDGQAQRLIRTFTGLGYRWVGEVSEVDGAGEVGPSPSSIAQAPASDTVGAFEASAESAPTPQPHGRAAPSPIRAWSRRIGRRRPWLRAAALLSLAFAVPFAALLHDRQRARETAADAAAVPPSSAKAPEFADIWVSLWRGDYPHAERQMAALPADRADTREAQLLAIHLDMKQGRFEDASRKLTALRSAAIAAADVQWRARSLSTRSLLNGAMGKPGAEVLVPAKSAVILLESSDSRVPAALMGEALLARGYGHMKALDYDQAMRDLLHSRDLLADAGNMHDAADAADTLARIHMRSGRYRQALELFEDVAGYSAQSDFPVQEIFARNAMTKINVELLRWDDALTSSERSMQLLGRVPESERRVRVLLLRARALTGVGRLREARALIAQAGATGDRRYSTITAAAHALAAGDLDRALAAALEAQSFEGYGPHDTLLLESQEGALLLWSIAARGRAAQGMPVPASTPAQRALLQAPTSTVGLVARGRWFWSQGQYGPAEVDLRKAFADARGLGHLSEMLAATEPLVESLLERGDVAAAEAALQDLWIHDPDTLERDYAANLLKLRVASASSDRTAVRAAYRAALGVAGERVVPKPGG